MLGRAYLTQTRLRGRTVMASAWTVLTTEQHCARPEAYSYNGAQYCRIFVLVRTRMCACDISRWIPPSRNYLACSECSLNSAGLKGHSAYDEVLRQASPLVDDRHRHSRDTFHFLFRYNGRLRRDALRSIRSHLRSERFDGGSPANGALVQSAQALGMSDFVQTLIPGVQDPNRLLSSSY